MFQQIVTVLWHGDGSIDKKGKENMKNFSKKNPRIIPLFFQNMQDNGDK